MGTSERQLDVFDIFLLTSLHFFFFSKHALQLLFNRITYINNTFLLNYNSLGWWLLNSSGAKKNMKTRQKSLGFASLRFSSNTFRMRPRNV